MSKSLIAATWDHVPHLDDEEQEILLAGIPAYQKDARTKGIPQLGSGAIYPIEETFLVVDPFDIPRHWPRGYGMDVGWRRTAAIWGAYDRDTATWYLYAEHYRGEAEPVVHAAAIRARGEWIKGRIDPASRGRGQKDGQKLFKLYRDQGLRIETAINTRESGIYDVLTLMSTGRFKVFSTCRNWLDEYRLYRRDEKGKIVDEQQDHLLDATRYLVTSGVDWLTTKPVESDVKRVYRSSGERRHAWLS